MRRYIYIFIILNFSIISFGQEKNALISFEEVAFNFRTLNESEGIVKHKFWFSNTGNNPLILTEVKSSCKCISVIYPKSPILPGKESFIEISYDPKDRPGPFQNKIIVLSNAINNNVQLEIKGEVRSIALENALNPNSLNKKYRFKIGSISFSTNHIAFSDVYYNEKAAIKIEVYNPSEKPAYIYIEELPAHLETNLSELQVGPMSEDSIIFYFDASQKKDWGFVYDKIKIKVKDNSIQESMIPVSARIVENFSIMNEQERLNAPRIKFKTRVHNFDTVYQGTSSEYTYEFTNTGKSDLIIRKVKPSCGCTTSELGKMVVKEGEQSYITIKFNAGNRKGFQSKTISVISNDPDNPLIMLKFNGTVVPPPEDK